MADNHALPDQPLHLPFRVATLSTRKPQRFDLRPDAATLRALAAYLDVTTISDLRFVGEIRPENRHDYTLDARLTARVLQPCGITLQPVATDIGETVSRRYLHDLPEPDSEDVEMLADDTVDPLPEVIDVGAVAAEALALALPPFPRAKGAALDRTSFAPPGALPLNDADLKPFAGLAAILAAAAKSGSDGA